MHEMHEQAFDDRVESVQPVTLRLSTASGDECAGSEATGATSLNEVYLIMTEGLRNVGHAVLTLTGQTPSESAGQSTSCMDDVCDGLPKAPRGKRRGRHKADYETEQRERDLAAEWKQAKETGVLKAEFAEEKGHSFQSFDRLLDRVAKRKKTFRRIVPKAAN